MSCLLTLTTTSQGVYFFVKFYPDFLFHARIERRRNSPNLVCDQDRAEYIIGKLENIFTARVFLSNSREGLGEGREYQSRSHLLETVHQYTKIS